MFEFAYSARKVAPRKNTKYGILPYTSLEEVFKKINAMRKSRLEARIDPEIYALFRRAAEIEGRTLSDFVVAATREAALRTIDQAEVIHLCLKDQRRFAAELIEPSDLAPAMKRAIRRHKELVDPFV